MDRRSDCPFQRKDCKMLASRQFAEISRADGLRGTWFVPLAEIQEESIWRPTLGWIGRNRNADEPPAAEILVELFPEILPLLGRLLTEGM